MTQEATPTPAAPALGPVAQLFRQALPGVQFEAAQTPADEAITISRDDFRRVMDAAKNDERLAFDYLRVISGVDWLTELESVYGLRSFRHGHSVLIKVRCPNDDAHVPTVSHLWAAANWHERETYEMFGIVYDGHPDLRPLLTEEGLGYYPLLKSHPLAPIEDWQEHYLEAIEQAKEQMAAATGATPVVDEKAAKIAAAQAKAAIIKKTRDEAREKGLSPEEQKAAVDAALAKYEEDQKAAAAAAPAAGGGDAKANKIQQAQAKAKVITKAREEARAKGTSPEEERAFVAEALKKFADEQAAAPAAAPAAAAPQTQASKVQIAQAKAKLITKTREEARSRGASPEEERAAVAEALKKFAEEQGG